MSTTVGQLDIRMNLELQRLEGQIDAANKKVANMSRRMQSDVSKAAKAMNKALSSLGVGLSIAGVAAFGKSVLDLGGRITDLANQAGLSTDAFQTFSNVAAESGVDAQQVANSFVQMRKNIQDAAEGSKGAADALSALGLQAGILQNLAPESQFEQIAKAIATATDKNKAFNAGLEILGAKNAPKLAEVLQRLASEGFDGLSKSVENIRLTPDQLKSLDDAGDKLERIGTALKVFGAKVFTFTVDAVTTEAGQKALRVLAAVGSLGLSEVSIAGVKAVGAVSGRDSRSQGDIGQDNATAAIADLTAEAKAREAKAVLDTARAQAELNKQLESTAKFNADVESDMASRSAADSQASIEEYGKYYQAQWDAKAEADAGMLKQQEEINSLIKANEAKFQQDSIAEYGALAEKEFELFDNGNKAKQDSLKRFQEVNSQMWENIADRTSAALSDMLLDGESKFKDFGAVIARMIADVALRLAVINPIINGVFGLKGTSALPAVFGARASGGPMSAGGSYLVGENGPELVTPTANSMVTPNHALASMGGSGGNTYNIDARGADMAAVARLERSLMQLAGPGVVEKRSIGAVANERLRGGGSGRGLGA